MNKKSWQKLLEEDLDKLSYIRKPVQNKTSRIEEGENRVVTIFFLDIRGFTALSEKLHPEEVKRFLDRIFRVFSNVIMKHGGYIDKYEGDMIMALFGSKKASETDTERAIRSGLEILQKLKTINRILRSHNIELSLRIGINSGLVTTGKIGLGREGDFTVYGDAVNLAARMESNAPLNSIMIPAKVKHMVSDLFEFKSLGNIKVKGKKKPIEVYIVKGIFHKKIERWERSKLIKNPDYIGREKEFKQIIDFFAEAQDRIGEKHYKPIVIGLRGNAGLGKSRFIYEFVQNIKKNYKHEIKRFVVKGYTKSYAQAPYSLWISLLKNYFGISINATRKKTEEKFNQGFKRLSNNLKSNMQAKLKKNSTSLEFLLGIESSDIVVDRFNPDEVKTKLQAGIRIFLEATASLANRNNFPLIVILEDLHWIDKASLDTFKYILTTLNNEERRKNKPFNNLFFLLSYRREFENIREFQFRANFNEFALKPLTKSDSIRMIESMLGNININNVLINKLLKNSEGNPFYIEEWIHSLINENIIKQEADKWQLNKSIEDISIPKTLNNLILYKFDRMNDNLKKLLQRASVIGYSFLEQILEEVEKKLGKNNDINQYLAELVNLDWLIKAEDYANYGKKYLFKHIIACDVVYETLLNYNKKILHEYVAKIAEEKFKDNKEYYPFLANHYYKADIRKKAIKYLGKAGDEAANSYNNLQALKFYNRLLSLKISGKKRSIIFHKKAKLLDLIGKWDKAEEFYLRAFQLSQKFKDERYTAKFCGSLGLFYNNKSKFAKAMKFVTKQYEIYREIDDKNGLADAIFNKAVIYFNQSSFEEALSNGKIVRQFCKNTNDEHGLAKASALIGNIYNELGKYEAVLEKQKIYLKISQKLDNKFSINNAYLSIGNVFYNQDKYQKALKYYQKCLNLSEELGSKNHIGFALNDIANIYFHTGQNEKALSFYKKYLKIVIEIGSNKGEATVIGNIGGVYKRKQEYKKAIKFYNKALKIDYQFELKILLPYHLFYKAECLYEMGKYKEAKIINDKFNNIALTEYGETFSYRLLKEKIDFALSQNYKEKIQKVKNLKKLLKSENDDKNITDLYFELALMYYKLEKHDDYEYYKQKAIALLKNLISLTSRQSYKNKLAKLTKL